MNFLFLFFFLEKDFGFFLSRRIRNNAHDLSIIFIRFVTWKKSQGNFSPLLLSIPISKSLTFDYRKRRKIWFWLNLLLEENDKGKFGGNKVYKKLKLCLFHPNVTSNFSLFLTTFFMGKLISFFSTSSFALFWEWVGEFSKLCEANIMLDNGLQFL